MIRIPIILLCLSEESTCPRGIVHRTPVSQDSTGLAVTPNEESVELQINYLIVTYPSLREQRGKFVQSTTNRLCEAKRCFFCSASTRQAG